MSKFAVRSVVKRAARSVSGQRPRLTASTAHSARMMLVKTSAKRNWCRSAAKGRYAIHPTMKSQIMVCTALMDVNIADSKESVTGNLVYHLGLLELSACYFDAG